MGLKKSLRFWGQARLVQELLLLVFLGRVHFHSPWAQFIKPSVLWKHLAFRAPNSDREWNRTIPMGKWSQRWELEKFWVFSSEILSISQNGLHLLLAKFFFSICSNLNHIAPQTHGSGHLQTTNEPSSQISEEVAPTSGFKERNQPFASGRVDPLLLEHDFFLLVKTSCWWSEIPYRPTTGWMVSKNLAVKS